MKVILDALSLRLNAMVRSFGCAAGLLSLLSAEGAILVGAGGAGPVTFEAYPAPTNGWSTAYTPGNSSSILTAAQMDAAAQTLDIAAITNALSITSVSFDNLLAQWHSIGYIGTRSTSGSAFTVLLAALQNNSGSNRSCAFLTYGFGLSSFFAETIVGYRTFYSFSGKPGEWQLIPQFCSVSNGSTLTAEIEFSTPWEPGSLLYVLWADDNGPEGDGTYSIDDLSVEWCDQPIQIAQQPQSITVVEDNNASISVVISNLAPVHYQWFKEGMILPGKTNSTLSFTPTRPSDVGTYFVQISRSFATVKSDNANLVVLPDQTPPEIISAIGWGLQELLEVKLSFSESLNPDTVNDLAAYRLIAADGSEILPSIVALSRGTNVTLTFEPALRWGNYLIRVYSVLTDTKSNPLGGESGPVTLPLQYEVELLSIQGSPWKYNHEGVDLGAAWHTDPNYDDNSWSNGVSVFDGTLNSPRSFVAGISVKTYLPVRYGTYETNDIPVYYFRTHFRLPTSPSNVVELRLRKIVDDVDVAFMNNYEAPVYRDRYYTNADVNFYGYNFSLTGTASLLGFFLINATNLISGENLMAVKLHQKSSTSYDISFAYELTAIINHFTPPSLTIRFDPSLGTGIIGWDHFTATLYETADLTIGSWAPVSGAGLSPGAYTFNPEGGQRFYKLMR
jgi:hypothetical protein